MLPQGYNFPNETFNNLGMAEAVIKDLDHVQALSLEHSVLAEREGGKYQDQSIFIVLAHSFHHRKETLPHKERGEEREVKRER